MSYNFRKRTHSLTKDINSPPITTNPTPRKKAKESLATITPKKVKSRTSVRSKDKQYISLDTPVKFVVNQEISKKHINCIGNSSSNIDNDRNEVNGELTRSTSSLSIEDNYNNNIGSNASSPLSSPPSSPNLENDAENDNDGKDD